MSVELIMTQGSSAGTAAPIHPGYYLVGRHKECQIRPKSRSVSRRHCLLLHNEDGFGALDLKSTGGTFVNGKRLEPHRWQVLHDGDQIRFGKVVFEVAIKQAAFASSHATAGAVGESPSVAEDTSTETPTSWHSVEMASFLEAEELAEFELANSVEPAAGGGGGGAPVQPSGEPSDEGEIDLFAEPEDELGQPHDTFIGGPAEQPQAGAADAESEAAVEVDSVPKKRPPHRKIDPKEYKRPKRRSFSVSLPSFGRGSGEGLDWKTAAALLLAALTLGLFAYQAYRFTAGPDIQIRENLD
jgi:pSer/pThr/pTyr-binding forkhead associated (FHA) protein